MATFKDKAKEFAVEVLQDERVQTAIRDMLAPLVPIAAAAAATAAVQQAIRGIPEIPNAVADAIDIHGVVAEVTDALGGLLPGVDLSRWFPR